MSQITFKRSSMWSNIGEISVQNYKNKFSVYHSVLFYGAAYDFTEVYFDIW